MERMQLQITVERKVANAPAGAKFGERVPLRADGSFDQTAVGGKAREPGTPVQIVFM